LDKQSSYLDVLDETSLQNCNGGRSTQNFIHACLVGANKGLTNLEGTLSSTGNGKYKNIF
jgi:hypothetical protein